MPVVEKETYSADEFIEEICINQHKSDIFADKEASKAVVLMTQLSCIEVKTFVHSAQTVLKSYVNLNKGHTLTVTGKLVSDEYRIGESARDLINKVMTTRW